VKSNSEIFEAIASGDLQLKVSGLNAARESIDQLVQQSVRALFDSPPENVFAISDRLFAMGPAVVPELEKWLRRGGETEAMTYAALILIQFGSRSGVPQLLKALAEGHGASGAIATQLADAGITGAAEAIRDALIRLPIGKGHPTAPHVAASLILALRKLDAPVPAEVVEKLARESPSVMSLL
jgi:hypothetical protein